MNKQQEQQKRVVRAQQEDIILVEQNGMICKIMGTTGSYYGVNLENNTCTCMDFTRGSASKLGIYCKHLCFMYMNVANKPLCEKLTELELCSRIESICLEPGKNSDCAICFENFVDNSVLFKCRVCHNAVHSECFTKWQKFNNNSCVYCRTIA
jgi:hypothetical protein